MAQFLYQIDVLPCQNSLKDIYRTLETKPVETLPAPELAKKVSEMKHSLKHFNDHAVKSWFTTTGTDYLYNPKLLANAPLTELCALLAHLLNTLDSAKKRINAQFKAAFLNRLKFFIA
ncbi:hypothetical protein [Motilimonas pumila]|uniref:Uncharacterized protein n=1 Tax=Motilimonas pumila TaxID=2303987 RepID=A0A418YJ84_9GAMM|nr:hypothetical protein [Motilimonas pumila]RJG50554.1 hypothetical protein D1Z90_03525 [Motilimonas pumila]